jgi:hypothetical protein
MWVSGVLFDRHPGGLIGHVDLNNGSSVPILFDPSTGAVSDAGDIPVSEVESIVIGNAVAVATFVITGNTVHVTAYPFSENVLNLLKNIEKAAYKGKKPQHISSEITKNHKQATNVHATEDKEGNRTFSYTGGVYNDGLPETIFNDFLNSIRSLDGVQVAIGGLWWKKAVTIRISLKIVSQIKSADIILANNSKNSKGHLNVMKATTGVQEPWPPNSAEYNQNVIYVNPEQPFMSLNGAHEFLHLMGVYHSLNAGCGVMSYCFKYDDSGTPISDPRSFERDATRLYNMAGAYLDD